MELVFTSSAPLSLGVELELQVIDLRTLNLSQDAGELLRRLEATDLPGDIKPEVTQSMIEINSSIHENVDTLSAELASIREIIIPTARKIDLGIAGGGTHPFQRWSDRKIYPTERFNTIYQIYGYLVKQFTVFGQHIHIGCESGDQAIKVCHGLMRYIPHFIALSASSPYYQETDTGFDTSRLNVISTFPTSGTMPPVKTWDEFNAYYEKLISLEIISSIKDLYWDVRPKPEFGTVEIRICDTPLQTDTAVDLAAYAQALVAYLINEPFPEHLEDIYLSYKYNRFQAARFGFLGEMVDPFSGKKILIHEDIEETLNILRNYFVDLNLTERFASIYKRATDQYNDAKFLRAEFEKVKALPDLVRASVNVWS